jgi:hypothetical protein
MLRLPHRLASIQSVPVAFRTTIVFLMYYRDEPVPFSLVPVIGLLSGSGV